MCYHTQLRTRTCRPGPLKIERKAVRRCVFCNITMTLPGGRQRPPRWCKALNTPGNVWRDPDVVVWQPHVLRDLTYWTDTMGRIGLIEMHPYHGPSA